MKKLWEWSGWILGIYSVYSNIKTMDKLRGEVYESLSPEQKAKFESVVGAIKKELPTGVFTQPIIVAVPAPQPTIAQVAAGV